MMMNTRNFTRTLIAAGLLTLGLAAHAANAADLPGKFQDRSIKGSEFLLRSRGQSPCSIKGSESLLDQWVRSRGQSPCSVKDSGWIGSKDSDPLIADPLIAGSGARTLTP